MGLMKVLLGLMGNPMTGNFKDKGALIQLIKDLHPNIDVENECLQPTLFELGSVT
jgi:hypothetical protein